VVVGVFGVPSALTNFGAQIVCAILKEIFGGCELVVARTVEDVAKYLSKTGIRSAILFNEYPDPLLVTLLAEEKVPIILFLNSFSYTVSELMSTGPLAVTDAVRTATICFSAIEEALAHHPMIIRSDVSRNAIGELTLSIIKFLKLSVRQDQLNNILAEITSKAGERKVFYFEDCSSLTLDPANCDAGVSGRKIQQQMPSFCGYESVLEGKLITSVQWPAEVFIAADQKGAPADHDIDLIGPARFLIYGPYFGLPRGKWLARPSFQLGENISGNRLLVDVVGSGNVLALGQCDLPTAGSFSLELAFEVSKPSLALEMRFQLMQGAIEGTFRLDQVSFLRL
jgi:hypothetical protein